MRCPNCGGRKLVRGTTKFRRSVDEIVFEVELPRISCKACREAFTDVEPLERFELGIAAELVRIGRCTPAAFRFMRKALGLDQVGLAELFGTSGETVACWESGALALDRTAFAVLGSLVFDRLEGRADTRARLELLANPKKPKKRVRIGV